MKKVIIHQPDYGIEQITPEIAEELLYDDIVFLPKMVKEHKIFTNNIRTFIGQENVLEFNDLLETALLENGVKDNLLADIEKLEKPGNLAMNYLNSLDAIKLADILISGIHHETEEMIFKFSIYKRYWRCNTRSFINLQSQ